MAKPVTASTQPMTDGQIENLVDKFRAAVRKHRGEFGSDAAQQALGFENLGMKLLEPFRRLVEVVSSMTVRHVKVDRTRTPQQVLNATGRRQCKDRSAVASMPRGEEDEGDIYFFQVDLSDRGGHISNEDLGKEFKCHGLNPVDPYKLAQANADDPAFADEHPNGTQWKDADGNWFHATFGRRLGERGVTVFRGVSGWYGGWWFAGLRK
ncbi:MAG: hypothetical protein HY482_00750 [Candidatus Wildermuthbacteria bacterium]|nr:hypothetical protein [Candidatus Wildermuthbacteria bacterium]